MTTSKETIFKQYSQKLAQVAAAGDAREESFYSSLEDLLGRVAKATGRNDVHVTTLPKKTEAGNPDFRIWDGTDRIIGYVEAKRPSQENLDLVEDSEQLRRYRRTFPNLILTNFLEFRLYRNGERVESLLAARPIVLNRLKATPPVEKPKKFWAMLDRFLDFSVPQAATAQTLAVQLANRTRFLRDVVAEQLADEQAKARPMLLGFYEAFQKYLIAGLTQEDFANLYAQTITYGLFAARVRSRDGFSRRTAFDNIPHTIGILRDVFRFISLEELPPQLEWIVDDISEVLAVAEAGKLLHWYYHDAKGWDPIVHFYETFLTQYDPEERERRGVYYTPEPVVSYIVRSLHKLLKSHFEKPEGLASSGVTLLDPAAGTMTFVARAAQEAVGEFERSYADGARQEFIRKHILRNFYAFELMMAPYAVGHLKMSFFLEELGHPLGDEERVKFYLTNTLDMEELDESRLPGFSSLAEESHLAGAVKKQEPILVILGNPPYSGHSSNMGEWIRGQIDEYKKDAPELRRPAQAKWLQDDYVKFLRFAQWKIDQAGRGVAGMITNHSYIDNVTFRGMRQSLIRSYDEIYVLDLHGSSLKREVPPDGEKDENVFDIQPGVAIAFFVKRGGKKTKSTKVYHAERWGPRQHKYDWLNDHDIEDTGWERITPTSRFFLLRPADAALQEIYNGFPSLSEIFSENGALAPGIVTTHDQFAISWSEEEAKRKVGILLHTRDEREARMTWKLCSQSQWDYERAKKELAAGDWRQHVVPILYRPFDTRWTVFDRNVAVHRRERVMRHMLEKNVALMTCRQLSKRGWEHAFVSEQITDDSVVSNRTRERGYLLPLYLYPDVTAHGLFSELEPPKRRPNLNPQVLAALEAAYQEKPSPQDIFHYVYAVLYAPTYRKKYGELLRIDFPRIPITLDKTLFARIATLGGRLVELHLLSSPELDPPATRFHGRGDGQVGRGRTNGLHYDARNERVCINPTQYFQPVEQAVWEYRVGGYQVCEKWLKDRRERRLELDAIRTYCRIATALKITLHIQDEIDALYPYVERRYLTPFEGA